MIWKSENCLLEPKVRSESETHSVVPNSLPTPGTIQSMESSSPESWSGELFPSPGDLPTPGIKPRSPPMQADSLPDEPQGKPKISKDINIYL